MGELWGVNCEDSGENWPRQHGIALYVYNQRASARKTQLQCHRTGATSPHTNPSIYRVSKQHIYMCLHASTYKPDSVQKMITCFIYWGPENANHFICIYMYKCINNSWYLQSGVLHIVFTKCHQSLRQWPLSTIRPWATGWARDGQGQLAIEYQIPN